MKTHTAIIGADGQRKITSTTEQLRIPASEIRPGDWLLKPHRRGMEKDRMATAVHKTDRSVIIDLKHHNPIAVAADQMVDVERTT